METKVIINLHYDSINKFYRIIRKISQAKIPLLASIVNYFSMKHRGFSHISLACLYSLADVLCGLSECLHNHLS
jgi:hypothetical protein